MRAGGPRECDRPGCLAEINWLAYVRFLRDVPGTSCWMSMASKTGEGLGLVFHVIVIDA